MPVPRTLTAGLLLILVPALLLLRWSRPRAVGLEQLMGSASLLQSFAATPERPLPPLWRQRLGAVQGLRHWQAQRRVWWQLWANQTESAPFLVLEADRQARQAGPLPPRRCGSVTCWWWRRMPPRGASSKRRCGRCSGAAAADFPNVACSASREARRCTGIPRPSG